MSRVQAPGWARRALTLGAAIALVLAIPFTALGSDSPQQIMPDGPTFDVDDRDVTPEFAEYLWFVEFDGEPTARGGSTAAMAQERNQMRRDARAAGIEFEERFNYHRLWNGMSVRASASQAHALAEATNATAVYPVELIDGPEPQDAVTPEMVTAIGMTGADIAQSELGRTGEGLSVAIIDTGIDYNHQDLGGDGDQANTIQADLETREMDHDRVTYGWDYVGDDYNAGDPDHDVPQPNPDPMDINGHGTHVAGIVGAEGEVTGVAPAVTFGAYKVFGTAGSSSADVIIAAMEDAHEDGMDIINMSLGAAFAWGDYPTSQVANELVDQGTVVVASAGNSGTAGVFSLGAPGNASNVIGVASADNTNLNAMLFESEFAANEDEIVPYLALPDAELPPTDGTSFPLAVTGGSEDPERFGCSPTDFDGFPEGSVALISRGGVPDACTFELKYDNAVDAGASAVIVYNNIPGLFAGGGVQPVEGIWAAGINQADGQALTAAIVDGEEVRLTFTDEERLEGNPTGGLISSFSSYGMTPDLQFRPDITAPGGLIESTYPLARGGYSTLSGTSMSAPHVAGSVALLLDAHPTLPADEVRGVLQNSAEPFVWWGNPGLGLLEPAFRQGAGMLRIDRAITSETLVTPSRVELGENELTDVTLTISNSGDEDVTYELSHTGTIGTGGGSWTAIFVPGFFGPTTDAAFSDEQVTVPAGETASVDVTIANPHLGLYAHQASGYIILSSDQDTKVVPFAGLAGQLSDIEIWPEERPEAVGLDNHLVAQEVEDGDGDPVIVPVPEGHTFNRDAGDEPIAAVFMGFAAERLAVYARHVESGRTVPVTKVDHARRSASPGEYLTFTWDGEVPGRADRFTGEWRFVVKALTVNGDPDDPNAWVEGETAVFNLASGETDRPGGPPPGRGGPPEGRGPR